MVGPVRAAAQDGTTKWLRHLPVTIGSTDVDQPLLSHPGFQGSHDHSQCKAELAVRVIQGRWKLFILRELIDGVRRFSDLQRALTGVSQKVLTAQLRELEADGVLQRTVYPEVPPRVEYALTALGSELIPVLEGLHAWGERAQGAQMGLETSA
jgi:DNA-binding HxlR family transcriptional regulator